MYRHKACKEGWVVALKKYMASCVSTQLYTTDNY